MGQFVSEWKVFSLKPVSVRGFGPSLWSWKLEKELFRDYLETNDGYWCHLRVQQLESLIIGWKVS